jgi:hypothetical protein
MEEEDRLLVSALSQHHLRVVHETRVTVVDGVAQLEAEHSISLHTTVHFYTTLHYCNNNMLLLLEG